MKKKSVDDYSQLTTVELTLLRPNLYLGPWKKQTTSVLGIITEETAEFTSLNKTSLGLAKLAEELLANARDEGVDNVEKPLIIFDLNKDSFTVRNNCVGVPLTEKLDGIPCPQFLWGEMNTSSNYQKDEDKESMKIGTHGVGGKLPNIFSKQMNLTVVTDGKIYTQTFRNNMSIKEVPVIKRGGGKVNYVEITVFPDFERFGCSHFGSGELKLMETRVRHLAALSPPELDIKFQGKKLPKGFSQIASRFCAPLKLKYVDTGVIERVPKKASASNADTSGSWQVIISQADPNIGYNFNAFTNGTWNYKGGKHLEKVTNQVVAYITQLVKAKLAKAKCKSTIPQAEIKNRIWVFVWLDMIGPTFTNQVKDELDVDLSQISGALNLKNAKALGRGEPKPFLEQMAKQLGIVDELCELAIAKDTAKAKKESSSVSSAKSGSLHSVKKLVDARLAGTKFSLQCTLVLTEGDSGKAAGLSGRSGMKRLKNPNCKVLPDNVDYDPVTGGALLSDCFGFFPLKGACVNPREKKESEVLRNVELKELAISLGLSLNKDSNTSKQRYGTIMIMADQDCDGMHIKGLVMNLVTHYWRSLIGKKLHIVDLSTPILKAVKGSQEKIFYSQFAYKQWEEKLKENAKSWRIKYYKGLGTNSDTEMRNYFANLLQNREVFTLGGTEKECKECEERMALVFEPSMADERKTWITEMPDDIAELPLPHPCPMGTFALNRVVIHAKDAVKRTIPKIDGFKPVQRMVVYTLATKGYKKGDQIKVAQLASDTAGYCHYAHGEANITGVIEKMARRIPGCLSNVNLLLPEGAFGTIFQGGKDASQPRYTHSAKGGLFDCLIRPEDNPIYDLRIEDGFTCEWQITAPVLPGILLFGSKGIATGFSTSVPPYHPQAIASIIKRKLLKKKPKLLSSYTPYFRWFDGQTLDISPETGTKKYLLIAKYQIKGWSVEINSLAPGIWVETMQTELEKLRTQEKNPPVQDYNITGCESYSAFITVELNKNGPTAEELDNNIGKNGISQLQAMLKLTQIINCSNMHLFDARDRLIRYNNVDDILDDYYDYRLSMYKKRKEYELTRLAFEAKVDGEKARFLQLVQDRTIKPNKYNTSELKEKLIEHGFEELAFPPNPPSFKYLLGMEIGVLMDKEKRKKLEDIAKSKREAFESLEQTNVKDIWIKEIDEFIEAYDYNERLGPGAESSVETVKII